MLKPLLPLTGLITCSLLLLNSCEPPSAATEQAKIEFEDLMHEGLAKASPDDVADFEDLIAHFSTSDDVLYANAQGWTMLHLACYFKKPELVRCLLLDGANPLTLTQENAGVEAFTGDSPMNMALFINEALDAPSEDIIAIIEALRTHGATMAAPLPQTLRPFDIAGICSKEDIFLYIAKLTPQLTQDYQLNSGNCINSLLWPSLRQWPQALQQLIDMGCKVPKAGAFPYTNLLTGLFKDATPLSMDAQRCAEILLKNGLDVNTVDEYGCSALFHLCEILLEQRDFYFDEDSLAQKIIFLLSHGADPYLRATHNPTTPDFCAYDFIKMRPSLLEALAKAGYPLSEPAFTLPEGDIALLACLCREYRRLDAPALFAPYTKRLQKLLLATGDITLHDFYPTALKAALRLHLQQDATKANEFINTLPLWSQELQPENEQMHTLILELAELPQYQLNNILITNLIEKLHGSPQAALIRPLMSMLSRDEKAEAQAALQSYLKDERKPLRLDAYCAVLQQNHLPTPGNSGINEWMSRYHLEKEQLLTQSPEIKTAAALNAYQELWFDLKTPEEVAFILDSLKAIGFPQAADYSQRVHRAFNDPETLDKLSLEDTAAWMLDLDLAIADYIWQHRECFLTAIDTTKDIPPPAEHIHGDSCMH